MDSLIVLIVGLVLGFLLSRAMGRGTEQPQAVSVPPIQPSPQAAGSINLSFGDDVPGTVLPHVQLAMSDGKAISATLYRVRMDAIGQRLRECSGRVVAVSRNGDVLTDVQSIALSIAPAERSNSTVKDVYPGVPEFLDVIAVQDTGPVAFFAPRGVPSGVNWQAMFAQPGRYSLLIAVTSPDLNEAGLIDVVINRDVTAGDNLDNVWRFPGPNLNAS